MSANLQVSERGEPPHYLAREIRAGQVYVDTHGAGCVVGPSFGGSKKSGHGRERGHEGLYGCGRVRTVAAECGA